ncbi:MAG: hypothetical protein J0M33_12805 [Anaerolineae bacterium]|nr:hypothetical protein [Anaerolineae bacterium]
MPAESIAPQTVYDERLAVDEQTRWRCPNCGQLAFGQVPPEQCDFCQDFTTWRMLPDRA